MSQAAPAPVAPAPAARPAAPQAAQNPTQVSTMLGVGSHFSGKLTFEGTVRIDGIYEGEIVSDDKLIIGPEAKVQAEIRVGTVIVQGSVKGNIECRQALHLVAPARVFGNITTPTLTIAEGVVFEGQCKMTGEGGRK